jgi:hypothetical protein
MSNPDFVRSLVESAIGAHLANTAAPDAGSPWAIGTRVESWK